MLADGRFPAHIRDMAIPSPKCTVRAAIGIEGEFVFFGGQCIELSGTRYVNRFEWCPILSEAIAQEVRRDDAGIGAMHRIAFGLDHFAFGDLPTFR